MKVKIGPHVDWIGPYQIAEKILFFWDKYEDDRVHKFGTYLNGTFLKPLCRKIHDRKKRKIKVKIDNYDTWNADSTMAYIILPILLKYRENAQSYFLVADEDAPEHLRSTMAPPMDENAGWDDLAKPRYDWVMGEIIHAFTQYNDDWEGKFFEHPKDVDEDDILSNIGKIKIDREGLDKERARIANGLRLFGVYYQGLWL